MRLPIALAALLVGCQATPTPSPSPLPSATASSTARPSTTPTPTATLPPTAALPPTATRLPEPVSVGISLDEAEQGMLTWFDPSHKPRIEWSGYVQRDQFFSEDTVPDVWNYGHAVDTKDLAEVLIVVLASTQRMDDLTPRLSATGERMPTDDYYAGFYAPNRQEILAAFDPYSGSRVAVEEVSGDSRYHSPILDPLRITLLEQTTPHGHSGTRAGGGLTRGAWGSMLGGVGMTLKDDCARSQTQVRASTARELHDHFHL